MPPRAVSLVWFRNPAGFAPGLYPSRLLPNGELVPTLHPTLALIDYGYQAALTWGGEWVLQMATNAAGPYQDVQSPSPYMVSSYDLPQQFFRLRR